MKFRRLYESARERFVDRDPALSVAFAPALLVAAVLFVRSPASNYIFDEQEALLANPFVNGKVPFKDVLTRDFWGLPHDRSIGSYRPLPNVVWRLVWQLSPLLHQPWALHLINIVVHALNAACIARIAFGLTRDRSTGWLAGATFAVSAVLTEAVTGVVGIADVFGALGLLVGMLCLELPMPKMFLGVFAAITLGLFSKESTLVALPILAWAALLTAPLHHPRRPLRFLRAALAFVAAAAALALYTETRRRFFPTDPPPEVAAALPPGSGLPLRAFHAFLKWFSQPRLPQDPINNPLVNADTAHRISGALRVYASGAGQVVFPWTLSGDYSFAAEPIPAHLVSFGSALGAALFVVPPLVAVFLWGCALRGERRGDVPRRLVVLALALAWFPIAYFPHSNIPVLLPTVRAERFLYLPAAGSALALGVLFAGWLRRGTWLGAPWAGTAAVAVFLAFQGARARFHALDYTDDLVFWRSTSRAVPMSAKAHLNYGVMLGARGQLEQRLVENRRAMEIASTWPMAHVYYADTLCRLGRPDEAYPSYERGMVLGPNDRNLVALALQCLWDHGAIESRSAPLTALADAHPGTWLAYLARDIVWNGKTNNGVEKKYRPRGYDEGPSE